MVPVRVKAVVIKTRKEAIYTVLTLKASLPQSQPGQFVMVSIPGVHDPLLPRPYSIYGRSGDNIELLVAEVGKGSRMLARMRPDDELDMLGPIGTSFPLWTDGPVLLVAGGVGIAPLRYWLQANPQAKPHSVLVFGGKTASVLFEPPDNAHRAIFTTDDGSYGTAGTVFSGIALLARESALDKWMVLACGPDAMLAQLVREWGGRVRGIWASLEARMACGVGACLGCVIPDGRGGYFRLCQDGPVIGQERLLARYCNV